MMSILKTHQAAQRKYLSSFWSSLREVQVDDSNSQAKQNIDRLLPVLMTLTMNGNAQAQYYLAKYLMLQDSPVALIKLTESADNNYPNACVELAKHYIEVENYNLAEKYFLKLFVSGDSYLIDHMKQLISINNTIEKMPKLNVAIKGAETATVKSTSSIAYAELLHKGNALLFNNDVNNNLVIDGEDVQLAALTN